MSEPIISVEGISKRYMLSHVNERTNSFREALTRKIKNIGNRNASVALANEEFWALDDVSFEIQQGDRVGIIGRNGAGKSTLLKILSRITEPTRGRIDIRGRVASLLEVGTGFHPELTGRENIFLNGAILGMSRAEIKSKFDEIVAFAEVEKFIDTPVKRYSSGMYVRLAFAVAAHLEPEILVVDEVLAVGDAEFQKKCLGKMEDVSKGEGRTVLFVSHSLGAVSTLCNSALLLNKGKIVKMGPTAEVLDLYVAFGKQASGEVFESEMVYKQKTTKAHFNHARLVSNGEVTNSVSIGKDVEIELTYTVVEDGIKIIPSIHLLDNFGNCIFATANMDSATIQPDPYFGKPLKKGQYKTTCTIPANFLNEIHYRINIFLVPEHDVNNMAIVEDALNFSVNDTGEMRKEFTGQWIGLIRPKFYWKTEPI